MTFKNVLSGQDAICLLELIHKSLSCAKEEDFRDLMERMSHLISYDFTISGIAQMGGDKEIVSYNVINISYPAEWLELYITKKFQQIDPIVKENFNNFRLQYWADTYKKHTIPREFLRLAKDFGFSEGYTHGVKNLQGGSGSLFSIAGRGLCRHPRTEIILENVIPHLHQALIRIIKKGTVKHNPSLSFREKEILNWLKHGKNTWDISAILGISENTVKFHIKGILRKFDTVNRTHAVAIAIEQGLIDIE